MGKIPCRREWQPTPIFLPEDFHGHRSLAGCSPWGHKELDTIEQLHFHFSFCSDGEFLLVFLICIEGSSLCLNFFILESSGQSHFQRDDFFLWHPTPVLVPGKSHGWRNVVCYSPWGRKELDTTEQLHFTSLHPNINIMKFFKQKYCKVNTHLHTIWIIHYYFTVLSLSHACLSMFPSIHQYTHCFMHFKMQTSKYPPNTSSCISLTKM